MIFGKVSENDHLERLVVTHGNELVMAIDTGMGRYVLEYYTKDIKDLEDGMVKRGYATNVAHLWKELLETGILKEHDMLLLPDEKLEQKARKLLQRNGVIVGEYQMPKWRQEDLRNALGCPGDVDVEQMFKSSGMC